MNAANDDLKVFLLLCYMGLSLPDNNTVDGSLVWPPRKQMVPGLNINIYQNIKY